MGKGKGLFERRIIRVSKNTILFEFAGISFFKFCFFIKKINKKLGIKSYPLLNKKCLYKLPTKKSFVSVYFKGYLNHN